MLPLVLYILSFLVVCLAVSACYGALKFDDMAKIRKEAIHTFVFFVGGVFVLALIVWYYSR